MSTQNNYVTICVTVKGTKSTSNRKKLKLSCDITIQDTFWHAHDILINMQFLHLFYRIAMHHIIRTMTVSISSGFQLRMGTKSVLLLSNTQRIIRFSTSGIVTNDTNINLLSSSLRDMNMWTPCETLNRFPAAISYLVLFTVPFKSHRVYTIFCQHHRWFTKCVLEVDLFTVTPDPLPGYTGTTN